MLTKRVLGRTGFGVTEIGFGAWAIGGRHYGPVAEREATACMEAYLEQGGNFFDTARAYGESERIIGAVLRRRGLREAVFVCSKSRHLEVAAIQSDLEETLRWLQRDYVDLYYLHAPPDDPDEMMRVLDVYEGLEQSGKIRAIGASIKGPDVTQKTVDLCWQYIRSGRVDVLQVIYSIFRQKNAEMFREASDRGVGIVARTALESGFLAGKYTPGQEFTGNDHRKRWGSARRARILEHAEELKRSAVSPPYQTLGQVALRFALDEEGISTVIVGAKSAQQVTDNLQAASLPALDPELRKHLIGTFRDLTDAFNTGE